MGDVKQGHSQAISPLKVTDPLLVMRAMVSLEIQRLLNPSQKPKGGRAA